MTGKKRSGVVTKIFWSEALPMHVIFQRSRAVRGKKRSVVTVETGKKRIFRILRSVVTVETGKKRILRILRSVVTARSEKSVSKTHTKNHFRIFRILRSVVTVVTGKKRKKRSVVTGKKRSVVTVETGKKRKKRSGHFSVIYKFRFGTFDKFPKYL